MHTPIKEKGTDNTCSYMYVSSSRHIRRVELEIVNM